MEAPPNISSGFITTSGTCHCAAETINPATAANTTGAVIPASTEPHIERRLVPCALSPAIINGESTAIWRTNAGMTKVASPMT